MINFIPFEQSASLLLIIAIYYMIVISLYWKNITLLNRPRRPQYLLLILVLIHLVFAFEGGDYYHYYLRCAFTNGGDDIEKVYPFLIQLVNHNYILFRLIVWGGALLLFILTAKRFGLDMYKAVYILYVMYFTLFDYGRASLGMAIFFLGLSFWCIPIKNFKILSYLIGPLIMLSSIFFHRSMFLLCACSLMTLIPMNKKILITSLLVFSLSTSFVLSIFSDALRLIMTEGGDFSDKVSIFANQTKNMDAFSIFEVIRRYIEYTTIIGPVVIISVHLFDNKYNSVQHTGMLRLYKVVIGIILLSISMLIATTTIILFYRILIMSIIPITILFFYSRTKRIISPLMFKVTIIVCLLQVFFNFSKRILGGNYGSIW